MAAVAIFTIDPRELLPLDSRGGERARVRHSLFGGGGAGPVESDSQSDIPRSKSAVKFPRTRTLVRTCITEKIVLGCGLES